MKTISKTRTTISVSDSLLRDFKQFVDSNVRSKVSKYMEEQIRIKKREQSLVKLEKNMKNQKKVSINKLISFYKDDRK